VQVNLGRRVAIKCLHPRYARDAVAIARFQHEAVVSGGFGHPHIVEVFDLGRLEDGAPFLVMERLEGETVTACLRRERRLALGLAVSVARQTVSALVATHARGILHRDLKPDNLFLVERGAEAPRVKVLDYGVSKAMTAVGDARLTRAGFVMGTPAYMAPEQARGEADLDGRVDLYAVGVILYEMVTGRLAYAARTPAALLLEMQRGLPLRPSMLRPGTPPALDALVMRCLAPQRDERPRDAAALQRELHQLGPIADAAPDDDDDPTEINEVPETFQRFDSGGQEVRVFARKR
jgi:serine/threonine protein kinase